MNKITKPISSPGRSDKFPPPLMRFLRSNVGNKSRRRSRASPMFVKKKNTVFETTQEPSSPKVTCIGQVRVRRSKKTTAGNHHNHHRNRHCQCLKNLKPRSFLTFWNNFSKWVSFFRCGYCKTTEDVHDSTAIDEIEIPTTASPNVAGENGKEHEHEHEDVISRSMPENAFLLTRCRSAPYRSSSLANIFRESTMAETGEDQEIAKVAENIKNLTIEDEDTTYNHESNGGEEIKAIKKPIPPLILSRCKSEPARRWDQLLV